MKSYKIISIILPIILLGSAFAEDGACQFAAELPVAEKPSAAYIVTGEISFEDSSLGHPPKFKIFLGGDSRVKIGDLDPKENPASFEFQVGAADIKNARVLEVESLQREIWAEIINLKILPKEASPGGGIDGIKAGFLPKARGYAFVDGENVMAPSKKPGDLHEERKKPSFETAPAAEKFQQAFGEIFVNADTGDDSNPGSADSPKATISSAMDSGAGEIVLQENNSEFKAEKISAAGRNIIFRASGNVKIKGISKR